MSAVDTIVTRLTALHPKLIDLSLDRMWRILAALDHPEKKLPPVIHVAGTNGKGSTVAFLRGILEAAGLHVHTYTSPHLVRINERFRLGASGEGRLVTDDVLSAAMEACERANGGAPITVFEITTAAGFLLFSQHPADVLVMEVGLGGRLDATNVIEHPLVPVITPVSIDHVDFLGNSIEQIAFEKAGILKRGAPAVIAAQTREALAVIERQAARMAAPLMIAGENFTATEERGRLVYQDEAGLLDLPAPRLFGRHQFENAGVAIAALRAVRDKLAIPPAAFEQGIIRTEWPARFQRLSHGDLEAFTPAGSELWLDGGHNADGGRIVAAALADLEERVPRPLVLIAGMLQSKDCGGFLRNFSGLAKHVLTITIPGQDKSVSAEALAQVAREQGLEATACASMENALQSVASLGLSPPPRILIAGSLYLAGEVLKRNGTPPT